MTGGLKSRRCAAVVGAMLLALMSAQFASAAILNDLNGRHSVWLTGSGGIEESLNEILNTGSTYYGSNPVVLGAGVDLKYDQLLSAIYTPSLSGLPDSNPVATMVIEWAGNDDLNTFGIYDYASGTLLKLFDGVDAGLTTKTVDWTENESGGYTVSVSGGDTATFDGTQFGFYLKNGSTEFFSEDSKNPGGAAQLLTFGGHNQDIDIDRDGLGPYDTFNFGSDLIIAWEDIAFASADKDFNDAVIFVRGVEIPDGAGLPEPATLAIWAGIAAMGAAGAGLRRRRRNGRWTDQDRHEIMAMIERGRSA